MQKVDRGFMFVLALFVPGFVTCMVAIGVSMSGT
jgi:hypothetical protein